MITCSGDVVGHLCLRETRHRPLHVPTQTVPDWSSRTAMTWVVSQTISRGVAFTAAVGKPSIRAAPRCNREYAVAAVTQVFYDAGVVLCRHADIHRAENPWIGVRKVWAGRSVDLIQAHLGTTPQTSGAVGQQHVDA